MLNTSSSILSSCTGEQLLLLAVANAGMRSGIGRVLDGRARLNRHRAAETSTIGAIRSDAGQPRLALRRAG